MFIGYWVGRYIYWDVAACWNIHRNSSKPLKWGTRSLLENVHQSFLLLEKHFIIITSRCHYCCWRSRPQCRWELCASLQQKQIWKRGKWGDFDWCKASQNLLDIIWISCYCNMRVYRRSARISLFIQFLTNENTMSITSSKSANC